MNRPRNKFGWRERLVLAVGGLVIITCGYGKILSGQTIYTNWQGFTVAADYGIFLGGVCLLASIIPWGRIGLLLEAGRKKLRR